MCSSDLQSKRCFTFSSTLQSSSSSSSPLKRKIKKQLQSPSWITETKPPPRPHTQHRAIENHPRRSRSSTSAPPRKTEQSKTTKRNKTKIPERDTGTFVFRISNEIGKERSFPRSSFVFGSSGFLVRKSPLKNRKKEQKKKKKKKFLHRLRESEKQRCRERE